VGQRRSGLQSVSHQVAFLIDRFELPQRTLHIRDPAVGLDEWTTRKLLLLVEVVFGEFEVVADPGGHCTTDPRHLLHVKVHWSVHVAGVLWSPLSATPLGRVRYSLLNTDDLPDVF
jgi:hypothetical protein